MRDLLKKGLLDRASVAGDTDELADIVKLQEMLDEYRTVVERDWALQDSYILHGRESGDRVPVQVPGFPPMPEYLPGGEESPPDLRRSIAAALLWLACGLGSFYWMCHLFADDWQGVVGLFCFMGLERTCNAGLGLAVRRVLDVRG